MQENPPFLCKEQQTPAGNKKKTKQNKNDEKRLKCFVFDRY